MPDIAQTNDQLAKALATQMRRFYEKLAETDRDLAIQLRDQLPPTQANASRILQDTNGAFNNSMAAVTVEQFGRAIDNGDISELADKFRGASNPAQKQQALEGILKEGNSEFGAYARDNRLGNMEAAQRYWDIPGNDRQYTAGVSFGDIFPEAPDELKNAKPNRVTDIPAGGWMETRRSDDGQKVMRFETSKDEARDIVRELKDQGIEAAAKKTGNTFFVEIQPESMAEFKNNVLPQQKALVEDALSERNQRAMQAPDYDKVPQDWMKDGNFDNQLSYIVANEDAGNKIIGNLAKFGIKAELAVEDTSRQAIVSFGAQKKPKTYVLIDPDSEAAFKDMRDMQREKSLATRQRPATSASDMMLNSGEDDAAPSRRSPATVPERPIETVVTEQARRDRDPVAMSPEEARRMFAAQEARAEAPTARVDRQENRTGTPVFDEDGQIRWEGSTYEPLVQAQDKLDDALSKTRAAQAARKLGDPAFADEAVRIGQQNAEARENIKTANADLAAERLEKLKGMNPADIAGYNASKAETAKITYELEMEKLQRSAGTNADATRAPSARDMMLNAGKDDATKPAASIPESGWQEATTPRGQPTLSYQTGTYEDAEALRDALKEKGINARPIDSNGSYSVRIEGEQIGKFRDMQQGQPTRPAAIAEQNRPSQAAITDSDIGRPEFKAGRVVWMGSTYPPLVEAQAAFDEAKKSGNDAAKAEAKARMATANEDLAATRLEKLKATDFTTMPGYQNNKAGMGADALEGFVEGEKERLQESAAKAASRTPQPTMQVQAEAPATSIERSIPTEPAKPAIDYRMETRSADGQPVARIYTDSPESAQAMAAYLNEKGITAMDRQKGNAQGVVTANFVEVQPEAMAQFKEFAKTNAIPSDVMRPTPQPAAGEFVGDRTDPKQQRPDTALVDSQSKQSSNAQTIQNSDGVNYRVLDTTKLDFDAPEAVFGMKTKPTLVRTAKPGEEIITSPGKVEESRITAKGGEVIFVNQLPDGREDAYIPRDANGTPNGQQILNEKYEAIGDDTNGKGALFRPKGSPSKLLPAAITEPTVIKDAWGPGNNQFLDVGATLKLDNGRVTGIDKAAFDETWSITDKAGNIATPKPPMDNVAKLATPETPTRGPSARANAVSGVSSGTLGLAMSAYGLNNSIQQGDGTGIAVASGNLATAAADTAADVARAAGRTVSEGAKGILKKANVVATVADGIYQIANEQEGYKGQRTAAVAATTATSIAAGAAGTALAGGLATGAAATVATIAAPITLAVGAAVGVGYIGDKIIETNKLNDQIDKSFQVTEKYRNATGAWLDDDIMARMDKMDGKRTLVAGGGYSEKGEYYDLVDPANVQKLKQAIKEEKTKYQDKMDKNESSWPRLLMLTDSQRQAYSKYEDAEWNYRRVDSAEKELDAYLVTNVAKDFNEKNRPALIAALEENKQFLRPGTKPEDLVPMLSTGDSIQAMQLPKDATPEQIAEKLAQYAPIARENEKKLEALKTELALINERKAIAAKEMQAAAMADPMAEKLAAFQKTDEYKFAQFKIGNLERGIEGTRAAEQKLGKNVDIDEKMEQTLLETRGDLLKKQEEFLATGSITRNSFSPAILEPLKPTDKQKPANGIDEANMAMAPKPEAKKDTSPMLSEGNTVIAVAKEDKDEPSKRPEDMAAALEKGGFFTNISKMASEAVNIANSGQLVAGTASDGATRQGNLGTPS